MSKTALLDSFCGIMISMLGDTDGQAFLDSYDKPRTYGLRINTLKIQPGSAAEHEIKQRFGLEEAPWCEHGYYYDDKTRPGRHPYHAAGLYYIQEPSAMSAIELLAPLTLPEYYRGWCLVTADCGGDCFSIGWGKASSGQLKNHLPKGLRQQLS